MGLLFIHKVRNKWECYYCKKDIPSGSYCVADDEQKYFKFCIECSETRIDEIINTTKDRVRERIKQLKNLRRKIMRNRDKYYNNNAVAVMKGEIK